MSTRTYTETICDNCYNVIDKGAKQRRGVDICDSCVEFVGVDFCHARDCTNIVQEGPTVYCYDHRSMAMDYDIIKDNPTCRCGHGHNDHGREGMAMVCKFSDCDCVQYSEAAHA